MEVRDMYKISCKKSDFEWYFQDIDSLIDFCHTLIDTNILYSIIKIKE